MMSIQYPAPLSRGIAWWPTVYDCISAIAAKRCGYNRVYFAAASLSLSYTGRKTPAFCLLTPISGQSAT